MSKDRKYATVRDEELGVEAEIRVTKEHLFYGSFSGQQFSSKNASEVEASLRKAIKDSLALVWESAIEIRYKFEGGGGDTKGVVSIELDRFYITRRPDGTFGSCPWRVEEAYRLKNMGQWHKASFPYHDKPDKSFHSWDKTSVVPYSEELWAGLLQLVVSLRALNTRLVQMIREDDNAIAHIGDSLLKALPYQVDKE